MAPRCCPWALWLGGPVVLGAAALAFFGCSQRSIEPPEPATTTSTPPPAATAGADCQLCMDQKQRGEIWDFEHHGNLLVQLGFRALADALSRGDRAGVAEVFSPTFFGEVVRKPREVKLETEVVHVVRQEDDGSARQTLGPQEWVEQLFAYRDRFPQPPKVQIALMTLAPVQRDQPHGLWQGTGVLRMWGEMEPGQPGEVVLTLNYRVPEPSEELFAQPGWLHAAAVTQSLVGHASRYLLRDATAESGIDTRPLYDNWLQRTKLPTTGGVYLCDYNRDGILDLLIADATGVAFYQGLPGGKFKNVTAEVGLPAGTTPTSNVAAFADLDGDGWEDLILAGRIYRNDGGKRFVDVTDRTNLRIPESASAVVPADYDRDGRVDLYVTFVAQHGNRTATSYLDGRSGDHDSNQLLHNLGNWQFEDVTAKSGTSGGRRSTFTALWLDADNDGWPDLYVPNEFGNGILLVNRHDGTFREQPLSEGPCDFGTMGASCGDLDNDGHIDIYAANMYSKAGNRVMSNVCPGTYPEDVMATMKRFIAGSQLHHNQGGLKFEQLGKAYQINSVGWAYGPALVDLDNDGFLDIYATCGFMSNARSEPDG